MNPGMRERHWMKVSEIIGFEFLPTETTTLSDIIDLHLDPWLDKFDSIAESASKEYSLEKALFKMKAEWAPVSEDHLLVYF